MGKKHALELGFTMETMNQAMQVVARDCGVAFNDMAKACGQAASVLTSYKMLSTLEPMAYQLRPSQPAAWFNNFREIS